MSLSKRILQSVFISAISVAGLMCPQVLCAQVNTDQLVTIGRNAMYFEDYVLAVQYFNQAIRVKPYLAYPYFYRSIAKLNLEDYRGAEEDATRTIELNPYIADAWEVRGVARQNLDKNAEAVEDYNQALALLPHNRQISSNMAAALTEMKAYERADSVYTDLLKAYPRYENGLLGRARMRYERADTLGAIADIDTVLAINSKNFNANAMRADIALRMGEQQLDTARTYLDRAIRLQPRYDGLYVNRAYLRYRGNDWFGAMSDYDYALELNPTNIPASFNRGLLEMETHSFDKALADFTRVLDVEPDNLHARFNRAVVLGEKHRFSDAIADINTVISAYPDFPTGYWMRSEFRRKSGDLKGAEADRRRAEAITATLRPDKDGKVEQSPVESQISAGNTGNADQRENAAARRQFASLLTVEDNTDFREEYNNSAIRGRVQDRNVSVALEPAFDLSYYASPSQTAFREAYIKEVDNLNTAHVLKFIVQVTNRVPNLDDDQIIATHFASIRNYTAYLASHTGRASDYIGRAMDYITVRDYDNAIADLNAAADLTPDFIPIYMLRAQARRYAEKASAQKAMDSYNRQAQRQAIVDDLQHVTRLSPLNPYAWYNLGNFLAENENYPDAETAYTRALEIKPDFGEAYFNRGYVLLASGQRKRGMDDLSRAGELGIATAYNLLKRLGRM